MSWFRRPRQSVRTTDEGITLVEAGREHHLPWGEIDRITAFKRDLVTTDLVCMEFVGAGGRVFEVNEDVPGYQAVEEALERRLHLGADWRRDIVLSAFHQNRRVLFERPAGRPR